MRRRRNLAASVGGWSARHRWAAIMIWVAFVAVATIAGSAVGTAQMKAYETANGDSREAGRILDGAKFPDVASEVVLVQTGSGGPVVTDARFREAVTRVKDAVTATGQVTGVRTPYDDPPSPVTPDKHTTLVQFDMKGDNKTAADRVQPVLDAVAGVQKSFPDLRIEQAGSASGDKLIGEAIDKDFVRAEQLSLPITFGILLAAFGALLAALVPLALAMTAIIAATGLLALTSQLLHVDAATPNLMLLIGLAVGVDYSLFYIRREREERAKGRDKRRAIEIAAATSGRAVLISGITVIVAMAGMFLTGNGIFMGFAEGTILVVLVAMAGSLTVLPALLSLIGDKINARLIHGTVRTVTRGRVTWERRLGRGGEGRLWNAVLTPVLRHPLVSVVIAGGLLIALAIPAFGLRTGPQSIDDLQGNYAIADTYKRIDAAFPGGNAPAVVVLKAADVTTPEVKSAIDSFKDKAMATGQANEPFNVDVNPDKTVARVTIGIKGEGATAEQAIRTLREQVIPATLAAVGSAHVTGEIAGSMDFNQQLARTMPLVFGFVLLLAFLLLLVSFRSLVVAVKAILLNLLSVAAAYGVLVLVFQRGYGEDLLGFTSTGTITDWLPLFLFVILFGLSMDYHVFILSRIREAFDRGMRTEDAVAFGIRTTAGVVTSAALIMVAVFATFATLSLLTFMQMGVGLAAAILIDATIIRAVLLPATMKLLGDWNWYLPRWLNWLPQLSHGDDDDDDHPDPVQPRREPLPVG